MVKNFKCFVIGEESVGKTSLIMTLKYNKFPDSDRKQFPRVCDVETLCEKLQNEFCTINLHDTDSDPLARDERLQFYQEITAKTGSPISCFLICFETFNKETILQYIKEIREECPHGHSIPYILVQTKADLLMSSGSTSPNNSSSSITSTTNNSNNSNSNSPNNNKEKTTKEKGNFTHSLSLPSALVPIMDLGQASVCQVSSKSFLGLSELTTAIGKAVIPEKNSKTRSRKGSVD